MPRAEFFSNFGLLVQRDFLDRASCKNLIVDIGASQLDKALLTRGLDEDVRRAWKTKLRPSRGRWIRSRLRELKPEIERHFKLLLEDCEYPQFLSYGKGDFFRPHLDSSCEAGAPAYVLDRRISVIVFLNSTRNDTRENDFGGGELVLYGLMKEPDWVNCGLPVDPEPGLLIAFPSDTLHEVRPVTFGRRFSIASWFYSPAQSST